MFNNQFSTINAQGKREENHRDRRHRGAQGVSYNGLKRRS
jgi:hypothetical protein